MENLNEQLLIEHWGQPGDVIDGKPMLESIIVEGENESGLKPGLYIEGVFMQAEVVNRNKRLYPKRILETAVSRYIKEQVATRQAKTIDASVALDSIFESVQLSPEAKANFSTVFEATVKKHAVALAESHIEKIAEKAEEKVEEEKEKAKEEAREELKEAASKYFDHIAAEWMAENQLAVDRGIKADLFESMFVGMKELFVEHNVVIPEESVDVVAEMEEELAEQKAETARLFEEVSKRDAYINYTQREYAIF